MARPKKNKKGSKRVSKKSAVPKSSPYYVVIDHPSESEVIWGPYYALRIGASDGGAVEVSIDGYEWNPARWSAGYWWFDWSCYCPGDHTIQARMVNDKGKVLTRSSVRRCSYQP